MKKAEGKRHGLEIILAVVVATEASTLALAKHPMDVKKESATIIVSIYDYAHEQHAALLAAEGEAESILARAGVNASWVDCPTSPGDVEKYPHCRPPWPANHYVLKIVPEAMAALSGKSDDALGSTLGCSEGPYCAASIFYDRVMNLVSGSTATASVLLGRVMAHEIGHLLLGAHSHSRTGVMQAFWSARELGPNAGADTDFTEEQSRRMRARLTEAAASLQAELAESSSRR